MNDERYMQMALELARGGLGRTWPNPTVGCVVVKTGEIISRARTANGGRPHAEALALQSAIGNRQSTIYVTLEPCSHHGKTPPCAEALINAGVAKVVIGCGDPDPRVSGKGVEILRAAGIEVVTGVLEKECREVNKGFFKVIEKGLPYVMLKAAMSADGKYLSGDGKPRWMTGEKAREEVHRLRSIYDAILTGTGTILADNPRLDCRLAGLEDSSPVKIVVGKTAIPKDANIWKGKEVWLYNHHHLSSSGLTRGSSSLAPSEFVTLDPRVKPEDDNILRDLAKRGVTRLMIEAGPKLSNALLEENAVDEVVIFQSAQKLGDEGKEFFKPAMLEKFKKIGMEKFEDDSKITFVIAH